MNDTKVGMMNFHTRTKSYRIHALLQMDFVDFGPNKKNLVRSPSSFLYLTTTISSYQIENHFGMGGDKKGIN